MKYAELKKLNRQALLEILVAQSRRIDELEGQLAEAKAALQERSIMMDDAAQSPKPHSRSTKYSKPRRQRQINTLRVFANPVHRSFTMGFLREKRRARYRHARFLQKVRACQPMVCRTGRSRRRRMVRRAGRSRRCQMICRPKRSRRKWTARRQHRA